MNQWLSSTYELQKYHPKAVDITFLGQLLGGIISTLNRMKVRVIQKQLINRFKKTYSGSRYPAVPLTTVVT